MQDMEVRFCLIQRAIPNRINEKWMRGERVTGDLPTWIKQHHGSYLNNTPPSA